MRGLRWTKSIGAALGCGALLAGMGGAAPAQAAPAAGQTIPSAQLPAWYHTPLTAAQIKAEVAVPKHPAQVTGPLRLTKADYTTQNGALAVRAAAATGHVLIAGESLQLSGAGYFGYGGTGLTAAGRAELATFKSAFSYVDGVTCEGYTDYGSTGATADFEMGLARASSVCDAVASFSVGAEFSSSATSYGERRPVVVGGKTHAQRAANRRVVIEITGSLVGAPKTPTVTLSSAFNDTATLDLDSVDGVLPVTGYQYSLNAGKTWVALSTNENAGKTWAALSTNENAGKTWAALSTNENTGTIGGLTDGKTYHVLVRDLNAAGFSLPAAALTVTPEAHTVPSAPVITSGSWAYQNDDYLVTLTWTEASAGSSPVTAWQWSGNSSAYTTLTGVTETSGVYSGTFDAGPFVCGGEEDAFTIEAVNTAGTSPASAPYSIDLGEDRPSLRHPDC